MCGRHVAPLVSQNGGPPQAAGSFTEIRSGAAAARRRIRPSRQAPATGWETCATRRRGGSLPRAAPAISPGAPGRRLDQRPTRQRRDLGSALLRLAASRRNRRGAPPGLTISAAARSSRSWAAASAATSSGRFCHSTSGWRRMVPVALQGASSSTASAGPSGRQRRRRRRPARPRAAAARGWLRTRSQALGRAVDGGHARARARRAARSCRPARRRDRSPPCRRHRPSSRAGSAAAASCTHQAPSA